MAARNDAGGRGSQGASGGTRAGCIGRALRGARPGTTITRSDSPGQHLPKHVQAGFDLSYPVFVFVGKTINVGSTNLLILTHLIIR